MFCPSPHSLVLLASMTLIANAYTITFYAGTACNSARLGQVEARLGDTCFDGGSFSGTASSAHILRTTEEVNSLVSFYDSDSCQVENVVSTSNGGCITVGAFGNQFGSFNVIGGNPRSAIAGPDSVDARDTAPAEDLAHSPRIPCSELRHGDFQEVDGGLVRMRQVAEHSFVGVPPQDWDDSIKPNTAPLKATSALGLQGRASVPDSAPSVKNESSGPQSDMNSLFAIPGGQCRLVRECTWLAGYFLDTYFPESTWAVVNTIEEARQRTTGDNILKFLANSFVSGFGLGAGGVSIYGTFRGDPPPQPCVPFEYPIEENAAWAETVVRAINGVASVPGAGQIQAVAARIDIDGFQGTLHIAIVPDDDRNSGQFCGAPAEPGSRLAGAPSRAKRSLYANV
jgi:hypothetical protein